MEKVHTLMTLTRAAPTPSQPEPGDAECNILLEKGIPVRYWPIGKQGQ